jgi:arsenite methyltransferase
MGAPVEVKACCAAAYGSEAAQWLLGDRLHPGGAALTSELGAALGVGPGDTVADVACGPGLSALQLARERGCAVVGIDISPQSVTRARAAAAVACFDGRVRFELGDAEALPLPDGSVDGVLSECALCTFPDKPAAAREVARVLRAGGRLALSDVTADPERLEPELRGTLGWVACVADARPLEQLAALLESSGLAVERAEQRDEALAELLDRIEARLRLARSLGGALPAELRGRVDEGMALTAAARRAFESGELGYGMLVARRDGHV